MKEKVTKEQIKHITSLANLNFTDRELDKLAVEMSEVIEFNISHLSKMKTDKVEPTSHALGVTSKLRKDEAEPGLTTEQALNNARETHKNFFKVKSVFGFSNKKGK